ncbi:MAG: hypothetical protein Kow00107_11800 [Planctomycetota bacterium]
MKNQLPILLFLFFLSLCAGGWSEDEAGWETFELKYTADKKGLEDVTSHKLVEPKIKAFISLPNMKNAAGFAAGWSDGIFKADTDGDGKPDAESRKPALHLKLNLTFEDGASEPYDAWAYRYNTELGEKTDTQLWCWHRSCFWSGKVNGETVTLYDDNANGLYNDLMEDSIAVGGSKFAAPYTGLIILKERLFRIKLDPHGHSVSIKPYEGETGTINIVKEFSKPMKGISGAKVFVVERTSEGEKVCLDIAGAKDAPVPVGKYTLKVAMLSDRIFVTAGKHAEIDVAQGQEAYFKWGGPFELDTEVWCDMGGYTLELERSGARPRYKQVETDAPTVKIAFPYIKGANGERYYGNPRYNDLDNNCFADEGVQTFFVTILDHKKKQVNKGEHMWTRRGNQGYGFSDGYTFEKYQWPALEFRGVAKVEVATTSKIFGDLKFEGEVNVEMK